MRRRQAPPPVSAALFRLAEHTGVLDNPDIQRLLTAATVTDQPALRHTLEQVVTVAATQAYADPFPTSPPDAVDDPLVLGTTPGGDRFRLDPAMLTKHLLIVGQSGAGKTSLIYALLRQLPVPFWCFDLKQDYRHLVPADPALLVLPWPELKFNPLQPPPGVSPRRWAQVFCEVFGHATGLLSASKNYLLKQVLELYQHYDLFTDCSPPYPSLHELQALLESEKLNYVRKTADYRDTVLNRLEAMTLGAGTIFDCSEGYALEALLARNVVFEFDGLGSDLQNVLMETLIAAVYEYRVAHTHRDAGLRHVFVLDEGKRVFSSYKEQQAAAGLPPIDELTAKLREFGEGIIVADQEATKLTDSLTANTYTKVLLATGDATQFGAMAETMHLTDRQRAQAAHLKPGEAIVQVGHHAPCPVQLTYAPVDKRMSDTALRRRHQHAWNQLTATPRAQPNSLTEQAGDLAPIADTAAISTDPPPEVDLPAAADRLLTDIVERPFVPLTERYTRFASTYQGHQAKTALVDADLVIERHVHVEAEKRTLLDLTERGREYAETSLKLDTTHRGRGGIVHRYWQYRLTELFEAAGWTAKREAFDADVYVNLGDTELAVEVAMGNNAREVEHVAAHLETFDAVWIVCRNEAVRDGIRQRLVENELLGDPVTLRLVRELPPALSGPDIRNSDEVE